MKSVMKGKIKVIIAGLFVLRAKRIALHFFIFFFFLFCFVFFCLASSLCFAEKTIYTQEVLAVVLHQLMEMNPLPTLFMRTVSINIYIHRNS